MGGRNYKYWVAGIFILLAAFDFLAAAYGNKAVHTFVRVLPAWFLFAATFRPRYRECRWIPPAFLFSGAGDMMGVQGQFLWQIVFFAAAHFFFIAGLLRGVKFGRKPLLMVAGLAVTMSVLFSFVLPRIGDPVEKVFVTMYAAVIFVMGAAAMFRTGVGKTGFAVAALLFMFSDSVIAWNMFVAPVPGSGYIIMCTYYAAQLLFALTLIRRAQSRDA